MPPRRQTKKVSPKKVSPKKVSPKKSPSKDKKHTIHHDRTYKTYIQKVFKFMSENLQLKEKTKDQLDQLYKALITNIREKATLLISNAGRVTIGMSEVRHALKSMVSPSLFGILEKAGMDALDKYNASFDSSSEEKSKAKKSGLIFPPGLTENLLNMKEQLGGKKKRKVSFRTGSGAGIYLAAVFEKITVFVLERAGENVKLDNRSQITVTDVYDVIKLDKDLNDMFNGLGLRMTDAKVMPSIDQRLLFSKEEKEKRAKDRAIQRKKNGTTGAGKKGALPGVKSLRDIKAVQGTSAVIIPKQSFKSVVKETAAIMGADENYRFGGDALDLLQRGIEDYLIVTFRKGNAIALHSGRKRLFPGDLELVTQVESLNGLETMYGYKKLEEQPSKPTMVLDSEVAKKITKPAIKRLAQRAGVMYMGQKVDRGVKQEGLVYDQTRYMLQTKLRSVLGPAITSSNYRKAKTLNIDDVKYGFEVNGVELLYSHLSSKEKKTKASTTTKKTDTTKKSPKKTPVKRSPKKTPVKKSPKKTPVKKSPKKTPVKRRGPAKTKK